MVPITFYKNGFKLFSGPFRQYTAQGSMSFITDLYDGYFPYELKDQYPNGGGCSHSLFPSLPLHLSPNHTALFPPFLSVSCSITTTAILFYLLFRAVLFRLTDFTNKDYHNRNTDPAVAKKLDTSIHYYFFFFFFWYFLLFSFKHYWRSRTQHAQRARKNQTQKFGFASRNMVRCALEWLVLSGEIGHER